MRGIHSSYPVHIWYGKTRMAGLQSGGSRLIIDSVVWAQHINETDTHTDRQPHRHNKCCTNALHRAAKIITSRQSNTPMAALNHHPLTAKQANFYTTPTTHRGAETSIKHNVPWVPRSLHLNRMPIHSAVLLGTGAWQTDWLTHAVLRKHQSR